MKNNTIKVRVTDEAYNMIKFKAVSANKTMSDYIRESVSVSEVRFNDSKDLSQIVGSINSVGNNINQIAKVLNIANKSDSLSDVDYQELKDELLIIMHTMNEITRC